MPLNYRRGGSTYQISIYDSTNVTWEDSLQIRQSGSTKYVQLDSNTSHNNASHIRIRKSGTTYAILNTQTQPQIAWGTGRNLYGALAQDDIIARSSPVQIGSDVYNWEQVEMGSWDFAGLDDYNFFMGIRTDGTLWDSGANADGALAQGDVINRSSLVQVGSDTDWQKISVSDDQSVLAIKTDGTLWSWGNNSRGQLCQNDTVWRSSPVQVGSDTDWFSGDTNGEHSILIKTDGTLWTCGDNNYGVLGLGDVIQRSSPVQVGSGTYINAAASNDNSLFIKSDGTLWGSGFNAFGEFAIDKIPRSSPVQVGSSSLWIKIALDGSLGRIVAGIQSDGTLWTWGNNTAGMLGHGDSIARSSPTQVGSDTDWADVSIATAYWVVALKTDGTLWAWGLAPYGVLGRTETTSSPVQIGSFTDWYKIPTRFGKTFAAIRKG